MRIRVVALVLALFWEPPYVQPTSEQQQQQQRHQNNVRGRRIQSTTFRDSEAPSPKSGFEDGFVEDCSKFLLSKSVLGDQKISKTEYADFLAGYYCLDQEGGDGDVDVSFASLNTNLRTEFIFTACPLNKVESEYCLEDFKAMGDDFGLLASPDTLASVDEKVATLCNATYFIIAQEGLMDKKIETQAPAVIPTPAPNPTEAPNSLPDDTISLTPTFNPALNGTDGNDADVSEFESEGPRLTTAAILGIISAASSVAFCVAVVWSGGWKEPAYDMNQPDPFPMKSKPKRRSHAPAPSGEDTFRDEDDDPHLGRQLSSNNLMPVHASPMGNGYSPARGRNRNVFRPPDSTLPPFHPANIETESQKPPKVAAALNPMNLLTPGSRKMWQPSKTGTSSKYGGSSDYLT
jgi:hypothetical protein